MTQQTDTDRLNFLLQFIRIDDVGDEFACPGIVVSGEDLEEQMGFGPMADGRAEPNIKDWDDDLREVIDRAMSARQFVARISTEPTWKPWAFDGCEDCGGACEILTTAEEGCAYDGDAARCTGCGATGGICCDSETRPSIIWNLDDKQP